MTIARVLRLHPRDNVGIALNDLAPGQEGASEPVPRGHKFALGPIRAGEFVRKYGQIIGTATQDIASGAHVHVQNLGMGADRGGDAGQSGLPVIAPAPDSILSWAFRAPTAVPERAISSAS